MCDPPLPPDWEEHFDEKSGRKFYVNKQKPNDRVWESPVANKKFCHDMTLSKMLAELKKTFIEPVGSSQRDRILSMDDGFEFLLEHRYQPASEEKRFSNMEGLSKLYGLCTGRVFSVTYVTDPDFVEKLAKVGMHCEVLISAF